MKDIKVLVGLKYFLFLIIILITYDIAVYIADYFYYDIFNKVDPYQGSTTFRIILTALIQGVLTSLVSLLYTQMVFKKTKYILYLVVYGLLVSLSIVSYIQTYQEFPFFGLWWFWIDKSIFLFTSMIMIGGVFFLNKFINNREN